jgi:hypothetical protein
LIVASLCAVSIVIVVVVARRAFAIIVDFVARRAAETACLVSVHFEEGFILLDVVDLDEDVSFFCCRAGDFCFGDGFVFVDEIIFPSWFAFCRSLAALGLPGVSFECFFGFGEVFGNCFGSQA